jgi:hypothetical protein
VRLLPRPTSPARVAAGLLVALGLAAGAGPAQVRAEPPREELRLHLVLSARPHGTTAEREALRELQYEIAARLAAAGAGELAGDAWPDGWCVVRITAPDAARALELAREPLARHGPRPGSYAVVRRARAPDERIPLAPPRSP